MAARKNSKFVLKDYLIIISLLSVFLIICISSVLNKSLSGDEIFYITSASLYLNTNEYTYNSEHPPLIKQIFMLPALFLKPNIDLEGLDHKNEIALGYEFLFNSGNGADSIIFFTRLINIILGLVLGGVVFAFSYKLFGKLSGFFALFLYSLSPNIIAHSRLATLDIGTTLFIFLTVFVFWIFMQNPSIKKYFLFIFVFSLAILTKFTSLLLIPIIVILYLILKFNKQTHKFDFWVGSIINKLNKKRIFSMFIISFSTLALIGLVIWIDYGFESPILKIRPDLYFELTESNLYGFTYKFIEKIPFFRTYREGLGYQLKNSAAGFYPYFLGKVTKDGLIWYFLVAFLIKTPIPIILLFFLSFFSFTRKSNRLIFLIVPIIILFLYFSFINKIFIGLRYILPIYPFIFVMIGGIFGVLWRNIYSKLITIVLCIWLLVGSFMIFPHYLSYFNEFIGGPDKGHKYLADSNIDWGQDLKLLKGYIDKNSISDFYISYWGFDSLEYRGLSNNSIYCYGNNRYRVSTGEVLTLKELKKAKLFVSVNHIYADSNCWDFLRKEEPDGKMGYSIFYFDLSEV